MAGKFDLSRFRNVPKDLVADQPVDSKLAKAWVSKTTGEAVRVQLAKLDADQAL